MHCRKLAKGIGVPLDYDEQWIGMADSKIFESAHHFRIESERQFESNLKALQGPTEDGIEKPLHRLHPIAEIKVNYNKKD